MLLSRTSTSRRLTRIAVAGALIALPLGALATTASAETPDPAAIQLTPAQADGADISGHPHGGPDWLPGGGPRVEHRDGPHHRGDGPRIYRHDPGPGIFFQDGRPSTGSAGSS